jgi:hypothetical protein
MAKGKFDIHVVNNLTFFMVYPLTTAGREWIDDNIGGETTWFGGGLAVESRYASDVFAGMAGAGLRIS